MTLFGRLKEFFNRKTQAPRHREPLASFRGKHGDIVVTHENALQLAACFACVRVISEDIAKLPWNVFARQNGKREKLDNQLARLLNSRPNPEMGAFVFRETLMAWALTWGDGYAEIERDLAGRPVALWPISPDRVDIDRVEGQLVYVITNESRERTILSARDVFHVHGIGWNGYKGYSMVGLAAESIGFGIAAEKYGTNFYGNNTHVGTSIKLPTGLSERAVKRLHDQLKEKKGSKNAFENLILEEGADFANPGRSQVDAQYDETSIRIVQTICRWWRVPPHKVAELSRAHFNNVESENINYATDTLMPWCKRLEEEADYKLVGARSNAHTRIALQGLMRGDSKTRGEFYKMMFNVGAFSPNKILELEDMDPIGPEGDENYIQVNMTTLKRINEEPEQEEETVEPVQRAAMEAGERLLRADLSNAEGPKARYDRDGFVGWMDNYYSKDRNLKHQNRVINGHVGAVGVKIDVEQAMKSYIGSARLQLLKFYDGEPVDFTAVQSSLTEVICQSK